MQITLSWHSHISDSILLLHICNYNWGVLVNPRHLRTSALGIHIRDLMSNHLVWDLLLFPWTDSKSFWHQSSRCPCGPRQSVLFEIHRILLILLPEPDLSIYCPICSPHCWYVSLWKVGRFERRRTPIPDPLQRLSILGECDTHGLSCLLQPKVIIQVESCWEVSLYF